MTRGLADTSVLIGHDRGCRLDVESLPDELAVSVITVAELRAGVLAAADVATRDLRLSTLNAASSLEPVPVDADVAARWSTLRIALRDSGQRMPVNDSRIAATAMALGVAVVTKDDDFPTLGILDVARV